jgi:hypothetical protein
VVLAVSLPDALQERHFVRILFHTETLVGRPARGAT